MTRKLPRGRASRRRVLSSVAAAGVSPLFASVASDLADAEPPTGDPTRTDSSPAAAESLTADSTDAELLDALSLGTFESGLDDWRADGAVELSRVARSDRPVAVTEGEYALDVSVGGESVPAISRPVTSLDLAARPYFVADVAPGRVEGTDAPVAFRFRLYRPPDLLDGDADLEPVAESDPVTVRQATPGRVFWDASDAEFGLLDAVSVLELSWYPADHSPEDGFAYRGGVVLDAVRATATADPVGSARLAATFRDLQFAHGVYERTVVTAESATVEEGEFVFADGETVPYRFEILADDRFRFAVAGTEIDLGSGWSR